MTSNLPIEAVLDSIKQHLQSSNQVVLRAPPGAGKTTLVPISLINEAWLGNKSIIVLEPRRIATKTAAHRMAALLNESCGKTIGYRMRLDSRIGPDTRVEVITEGILARMLQKDPALEKVGLVIFDEYHERSLDTDLALALCMKGRDLYRESDDPLKILVMSATLDVHSIADLLGDAPIVESEGRSYPVDVFYQSRRSKKEDICQTVVTRLKQVIADNPESSVLVFLPGQGEIMRVNRLLEEWLASQNVSHIHLKPLFGNMSIEQQQEAIQPLSGILVDDQKVVLATNIAETSLTIEGVDIVVDSGLVRESFYNPATAMSGLRLRKISRASSVQRAGRAGRLKPGVCYRLWTESEQQGLDSFSTPEILRSDITPLAMHLLNWGIDDPADLQWIDKPPDGAWNQSLSLLKLLGAAVNRGDSVVLSEDGESMAGIPVHPRLAHMLVTGCRVGRIEEATDLASLLSDTAPANQTGVDIEVTVDILSGKSPCPQTMRGWRKRVQQVAKTLLSNGSIKNNNKNTVIPLLGRDQVTGYLLALAFPDRIARRRHSGAFQLSNGRSAELPQNCGLSKSQWIVVAEVSASLGKKSDQIRSAAAFDPVLFENALKTLVKSEIIMEWDVRQNRFIAESRRMIGHLVLDKAVIAKPSIELKNKALIAFIKSQGLSVLNWSKENKQWLSRIEILRCFDHSHNWPDFNEKTLLDSLDDWLVPYLDKVNTLSDIKKLSPGDILKGRLNWQLLQLMDQLVPQRLKVPSGSLLDINYLESPPVLAVKLQEMFGCEETPAVVNGKLPLIIHLLSPAGRPLQITQDLAGFWRSSYHDVKKEMKGRYPKHPWPDNPLIAIPTRKTKNRMHDKS